MKKIKIIIMLIIVIVLCGCGKEENYETLKDKVKVGDYILLSSDNKEYIAKKEDTGCESDQTISFDNIKYWVVTNKTEYSLELYSLTVSKDELCFKGRSGYANYIYVLNDLVKSYSNKLIVGSRHFGYSNQTEKITDYTCLKNHYDCEYNGKNTEEYGYGDEGYLEDYKTAKFKGILAIGTDEYHLAHYWIASRKIYSAESLLVYYMARYASAGSNFDVKTEVLYEDSSNTKNSEYCHSVRPIIYISNDAKIVSGDGESVETGYVIK